MREEVGGATELVIGAEFLMGIRKANEREMEDWIVGDRFALSS